jgi:hypothetical protein
MPKVAPAVLLFSALVFPAHGDEGVTKAEAGFRPSPAVRAQMRARIQELRAQVLRQRVGLPESTALNAERILNQFDTPRHELRKSMFAQRRALKELIRQNSDDERAYRDGVEKLLTLRKQMQALRDRELEELRKILSAKEQAKLVMAMHHIGKRIHQMWRRFRGQAIKNQLQNQLHQPGIDTPGAP